MVNKGIEMAKKRMGNPWSYKFLIYLFLNKLYYILKLNENIKFRQMWKL